MDFQDIHDFDFDCLEEFEGDFGFLRAATLSQFQTTVCQAVKPTSQTPKRENKQSEVYISMGHVSLVALVL